jgi:uncharacterized membrane protein
MVKPWRSLKIRERRALGESLMRAARHGKGWRADDAINKTVGSMKPIAEFLKSTILGGLLVLLPLLLLWSLFAKAFDIIVKMATPVVHLLPRSVLVEAPRLKELLAVVVLVSASFIFGMLLRASFFRSLVNLMESHTLGRLPVYAALKGLVSEAFQPESAEGFKPAMLLLAEGMQRPAYVIEDHGDGNLTVFLPSAPAAFSGMVHVVSRDRVVFLDVNLIELIQSIARYGVGQRELLRKKKPNGAQGDDKAPPRHE